MRNERSPRIWQFVVVAICGSLASAVESSAQVQMLYATKIPAGSSFVRVADGGASPVSVAIGPAVAVSLAPTGPVATSYRLVTGGTQLTITVDGKVHALDVPANRYLTYIYRPGSASAQFTAITDDPGEDNGLRAELRFYNLVPKCDGALSIENGPAVFEGVATDQSRSRSINPVAATLVPKCGSTAGPALKLPLLKAQERYSIFLVGHFDKPSALGNSDVTENNR